MEMQYCPLFSGFILALLFLALPPSAEITSDGEALLVFLQSVKGNKGILHDWNSLDSSPCDWTGILCSPAGRVVNISFSSVQLEGSIPPQFGSLSALRYLRLASTNLTGTIPKELCNCSRLELLDLSANNLSGVIPSDIGQLHKLRELRLELNQIQGPIPSGLGNCTGIRILTLHDNQLGGSLPPELGLLRNLENFRAGGNQYLSGRIPPELANCTNLLVLGLAATIITGFIPPAFGKLSNLTVLSLYQANLSGAIPRELGSCSRLQSLYLYENMFSGRLPRELGQLKELSSLFLWGNELTGIIPPEMGSLVNLRQLDLSQNSLTGNIPSTIGNLTSIQDLYLSVNHLSGQIPSELGNCRDLQDLQLDRNELSGMIPEELGKLTSLSQVFLWNNSLEGALPSSLANCSGLVSLDFSWNHLSGPIPVEVFYLARIQKLLLLSNNLSGVLHSEIGQCRELVRLRLGNNLLAGPLPVEIGLLQQLTFIDLSNNQFSGIVPPEIGNCASLQLLDIHGNLLDGNLPSNLGSLKNLQVLDASYNRFTGIVPSVLGNLGLLNKLYLQGNFLTGVIPSELSGCAKLELLDLSHNMLSGVIPPPLGRVESLTIALNLSWNNLSGPIPEQFSGLSNLGSLDLSHNNLSGELAVIGRMDHLVTLNISCNHFTGALPDTYLFQTLPNSDYQGNVGLCVRSSTEASCFTSIPTRVKRFQNWAIIPFTIAAVLSVIVFVLYFLLTRKSHVPLDETEVTGWPWQFTTFQKLNFFLEDVLERLVDANIIGQGYSGVVYRVEMPGGNVIAVKKVLSYSKRRYHRDVFETEIETLGAIRHRNIVRLLGYCSDRETRLLMYDYMPNGSLGEALHVKKRMLDWEVRYKIILGAAQGLAYLHHDCLPAILHRDVKANNILLGPRYEPYLADFGLAKLLDSPGHTTQTSLAGSYGYIAPEYGYTLTITDKSDVYSYGVVMLEVLTGKKPVDPSLGEGRHLIDWIRETQQRSRDLEGILDSRLQGMPDHYIHEMVQALGIALDCVHPIPEERPTMRHVASLLVGIKHDLDQEYAKIDVLAQKCKKGSPPDSRMLSRSLSQYAYSFSNNNNP